MCGMNRPILPRMLLLWGLFPLAGCGPGFEMPTDTTPPALIGEPALVRRATGCVIAWITTEPALSTLELFATGGEGGEERVADIRSTHLTRDHRFRCSGLTPETTYRVAISLADLTGNEAEGVTSLSFETLGVQERGVVINEVVTDPQRDWNDTEGGNGIPFDRTTGTGQISEKDEWIELLNTTEETIDLEEEGWLLEMNDTTPERLDFAHPPPETVLRIAGDLPLSAWPPGRHLVIGNPPGQLNNDDLTLLLSDPSGRIVDVVAIEGTLSGNAEDAEDESLHRLPDGIDTDDAAGDFTHGPATIGSSNGDSPRRAGCAFFRGSPP
ncbi:MAG: lamin tail domain-containing protein [Deltaproteobacteria bacterium]|nr:MAG: lamin tail domain-containing protein [Deltaproteobacteria bacterium]